MLGSIAILCFNFCFKIIFEVLHGEVSLYIWFAVTPSVYQVYLPGRVCSLEKCLAIIFYYRGVDLSNCSGDFSVLKSTVLHFNYYLGGRYRKLAVTTALLSLKDRN